MQEFSGVMRVVLTARTDNQRRSSSYSIRSDFGTFGISVGMRCIVDRNM